MLLHRNSGLFCCLPSLRLTLQLSALRPALVLAVSEEKVSYHVKLKRIIRIQSVSIRTRYEEKSSMCYVKI